MVMKSCLCYWGPGAAEGAWLLNVWVPIVSCLMLAEFCQVSRVESPVVCSLSGIQRREGETDRQTPSPHTCPSSSWHLGHLRNTAGICSHSKQVFLRVSVTTRTHQSLRPKWLSVEIIPVQTHKRRAKSVCQSFVHSSLLSFVLMGGWHLRVLEF